MSWWRCILAVALLCCGWAAHADDKPQKHFFWKVTGDKGTVYLLGTIHVGRPDFYPLPPVVEESFKKSSMLVLEVDPSDKDDLKAAATYIARTGVYPFGDAIGNHLSELTRARFAQYAGMNHLDGKLIAHLRPWAARFFIGQSEAKQMGLKGGLGIDDHFYKEATAMNKPVAGLESMVDHYRLFAEFPDEMQDELLLLTVVDAKNEAEKMTELFDTWKSGDMDALEKLLRAPQQEYPFLKPLMVKMLDDRNDKMVEKIEGVLRTPKTYFIAVGAGHMVGERGLIAQLRAQHFKIEQM